MDILEIVNESNRNYIKNLKNLQDIKYDGLTCPKCFQKTVTTSGYTWCPSTVCDYGNELKLNLLTKFI